MDAYAFICTIYKMEHNISKKKKKKRWKDLLTNEYLRVNSDGLNQLS